MILLNTLFTPAEFSLTFSLIFSFLPLSLSHCVFVADAFSHTSLRDNHCTTTRLHGLGAQRVWQNLSGLSAADTFRILPPLFSLHFTAVAGITLHYHARTCIISHLYHTCTWRRRQAMARQTSGPQVRAAGGKNLGALVCGRTASRPPPLTATWAPCHHHPIAMTSATAPPLRSFCARGHPATRTRAACVRRRGAALRCPHICHARGNTVVREPRCATLLPPLYTISHTCLFANSHSLTSFYLHFSHTTPHLSLHSLLHWRLSLRHTGGDSHLFQSHCTVLVWVFSLLLPPVSQTHSVPRRLHSGTLHFSLWVCCTGGWHSHLCFS